MVVSGTDDEVAAAVSSVLSTFAPMLEGGEGKPIVTVAEGDKRMRELAKAALPEHFEVRSETMLAIKGLERRCVLWSTDSDLPSNEATQEWIYTILTRSTCLVVVVLSDAADPAVRSAVSRLRRDRLQFFTREAAESFDAWVAERRRADKQALASAVKQPAR